MNDQAKIANAAHAAAVDWYRRQCQTPMAMMYLYYKPQGLAFWIGEDPLNDTWQLAHPVRVSPMFNIDKVIADIVKIAQKLPILPIEEDAA